ncbi:dolichyl-P-Glc:Man9GlcNAc2-PP-dolichol alpha-1,3-glucosyltransferase [Malassezia vespertilionis]|uniref:dolichyl-P-Glc:Man9GlcNAc2-PP-dolichol alpha-1,3-glucosyltransferase n=1 Tax=Malassezia vespertilionis TaxID=2020962 RepID=A0A2N1JBI3_9BASI|nr:dolichyl-P-Glc:Man9GlcNAc2-PP-dolichol alpha-1,3-glucosyltransferase [Malassezia vespertilionis]PKI83907.1 Alg6p [Malassezia vespertilionis]WFD06753.1 dolichyl-P-Glc:Man9GlcNAc2-PP-dolichol alpha-1,3-glucosyltransferase [Malassezia vespertilionis]
MSRFFGKVHAAPDADADLDRAADMPVGNMRSAKRRTRDKASGASVSSSTRGPPPSLSSRSHARPGTSRHLDRIQDVDANEHENMENVQAWAAQNQQKKDRRVASSETQRPHVRNTRVPSATHDAGSARGSTKMHRYDASSVRAVPSSRALRTQHGAENIAMREEVLPESLTKNYERIANWRESNAQLTVSSDTTPALRKSASWLSQGGLSVPNARGRAPDAASVASSRRYARTQEESAPPKVVSRVREGPSASYNADSPIRDVLRWMAQEEMQQWVIPLGLGASLLVRCMVALGGFSGRGTSPMHGDFEAQRHWIEMTLHVPTVQWYRYDLPYWGLDYPPLTAWVSLVCGYVASFFPLLRTSFALYTSRGNDSTALVLYMRISVLALEALIYIPAVFYFLERRLEGRSVRARHVALFSVLLQPALILIDHGHFQYNAVMLGFSAACFALLCSKLPNVNVRAGIRPGADTHGAAGLQRMLLHSLSRQISYEYVIAAIFFSLSLCFKQMALYFSPAIFAVMLGRCVGLARQDVRRGAWLFLGLAVGTSITFLLVFFPWIGSRALLQQCIHRIFPLARGVFEDKVANVWCFMNVLPLGAFKLKHLFSTMALAKLSLVATLLAILPGSILLFRAGAETARLETILDDAQAEQVVATVRRHAGSIASGRDRSVAGSQRFAPSIAAPSITGSAHESSRGSDRRSIASGSIFAGSQSTWMAGSIAKRPARRRVVSAPQRPISSSPSPAASLLPYTLVSTSLAFFLLGFQTHEKSILLPLLPLTLLLTTKGDRTGAGAAAADWEWAVLANNVGVFGMWPLLLRDGQGMQALVLTIAWNAMVGYSPFAELTTKRKSFVAWFSACVHGAILVLLLAQLFTQHSALLQRYPDLFPVLNVLLVTPVLAQIWLWSMKKQVEVALATGLIAHNIAAPKTVKK